MRNLQLLTLFLLALPFVGFTQSNTEPYRIKTVVIDAGHGGKDPGNLGTGRYKWKEKQVAMDVALKLGGYIKEQYPNINLIYTRDTDVFIGLNERAEIANTAKADIFISIHCNAVQYESAYGVETYALGLHKNEENLQVAMKENSAIFLEDDYEAKYEGFDPNSPESLIALTMMQSAFLDQSLRISSYIQKQFKERVGRRDRGVKQAGFLVLRKTTMPSILIELGFLTNPKEEDFLNSENGRVYMASAILRGFKEYKQTVEDPLGENPVEEETVAVSQDLKQAELKAELERKKAELAKQKGIDLAAQAAAKAKEDSLALATEKKAAAIKAEQEAQKLAKEKEEAAAKAKLEEKKAEDERIAAEKLNEAGAKAESERLKAEEERLAALASAEADRVATEKKAEEAKAAEAVAAEKLKQDQLEKEKAEKEAAAKLEQEAEPVVTPKEEPAKLSSEHEDILAELKRKKAEIEARLAKLEAQETKTEKEIEQKTETLNNVEPVKTSAPIKKQPKEEPATKTITPNATGLVFKIQIHTATKALDTSSSLFRDVEVWEYVQGGLYKYTTGEFSTVEQASSTQSKMRDLGFKGAFVVAFLNGERIKVSKARKILEAQH